MNVLPFYNSFLLLYSAFAIWSSQKNFRCYILLTIRLEEAEPWAESISHGIACIYGEGEQESESIQQTHTELLHFASSLFNQNGILYSIFKESISSVEMNQTRRKGYYGGSLFSFGSKPTGSSTVSNLKAKRNYNVAHSKSRVANILSKPGQLTYTNKQAIEAKYQQAIQQLSQIEKPKDTVSALQAVSTKLETALQSQVAKETGAVVITIPIGLAQLAVKAIRIFLSVLIVIFVDLPLGVFSGSPAINLAAAVAPNRAFNTTARAYQQARKFTGANSNKSVVNYA